MGVALQALPAVSLSRERLPWPAALYLLCLVIPVWFNVGPLSLSLLRLFLLLMILPLAIQMLAGRFGRLLITDVLFVAHLLWATAALAVNNPTQVVGQFGSVGVEFLGGYLVARASIRTPQAFLALGRWLVMLVLCLTPFALYEARTSQPIILETIRNLPGIDSFAKVRPDPRLGMFRTQTVFAHAIHHGLFCSVAFSLAFVALKGAISDLWRWISASMVALTGFLALSSGAFLAILLQVALIGWAALFAHQRWRWWLLVGLFVLAYVAIDVLSTRDPIRVLMSYATFSSHNAYWRSIIFEWGLANVIGSAEKGIAGSPLFGIGLNDWIRPSYMYSGSMDNFWLVMAVRYGVPGFLFLAAGYAWAIFLIMRRDFTADVVLAQIRRAWVFTLLGLTFTLVTVHVWSSIYSFVFFMFGAGIWLIAAEPATAAGPAEPDPPGHGDAPPPHPRGPRYSRFPAAPSRRRAAPASS